MMGGMALQMERTIGVGDWIKFNGQEGLVKDIRWRHTSIRNAQLGHARDREQRSNEIPGYRSGAAAPGSPGNIASGFIQC